jgi:alkylated DNA repair protein alkB family protein 8
MLDLSEPLPMPQFIRPCLESVCSTGYFPDGIDQVTVNEYLPGHGIAPHVDTHSAFQDAIASLSLGGSTVMDLKHTATGVWCSQSSA